MHIHSVRTVKSLPKYALTESGALTFKSDGNNFSFVNI